MRFVQLFIGVLLAGLLAGCSQAMPESSSAIPGTASTPPPEWAWENSEGTAGIAASPAHPFPETDEVAIASETSPAIKPIPEDSP